MFLKIGPCKKRGSMNVRKKTCRAYKHVVSVLCGAAIQCEPSVMNGYDKTCCVTIFVAAQENGPRPGWEITGSANSAHSDGTSWQVQLWRSNSTKWSQTTPTLKGNNGILRATRQQTCATPACAKIDGISAGICTKPRKYGTKRRLAREVKKQVQATSRLTWSTRKVVECTRAQCRLHLEREGVNTRSQWRKCTHDCRWRPTCTNTHGTNRWPQTEWLVSTTFGYVLWEKNSVNSVGACLCAWGHADRPAQPSKCPPPALWHCSSRCGQEQMARRISSRGRLRVWRRMSARSSNSVAGACLGWPSTGNNRTRWDLGCSLAPQATPHCAACSAEWTREWRPTRGWARCPRRSDTARSLPDSRGCLANSTAAACVRSSRRCWPWLLVPQSARLRCHSSQRSWPPWCLDWTAICLCGEGRRSPCVSGCGPPNAWSSAGAGDTRICRPFHHWRRLAASSMLATRAPCTSGPEHQAWDGSSRHPTAHHVEIMRFPCSSTTHGNWCKNWRVGQKFEGTVAKWWTDYHHQHPQHVRKRVSPSFQLYRNCFFITGSACRHTPPSPRCTHRDVSKSRQNARYTLPDQKTNSSSRISVQPRCLLQPGFWTWSPWSWRFPPSHSSSASGWWFRSSTRDFRTLQLSALPPRLFSLPSLARVSQLAWWNSPCSSPARHQLQTATDWQGQETEMPTVQPW